MKINTASTIKYILTLVAGGALLYFVFSGMDFKSMVFELKRANYTWIIVSMTVTLLSHFSRAYRWNLLLKPLGYNVKLINSFQAVMIGYFANLAFPRLGEVTRCSVLKRTDDIPVDVSLGTVITERVVDVIMSGILLGLCFILEFARLKDFFSVMVTQKVKSLTFLSGKGLMIIILLSMFSIGIVLLSYIYRQKLLDNSFVKKIASFLSGILKGLLSIQKMENKWSFMFHSVFIWFIYFLVTYIIFFSMEDTSHLPVSAGLVAMVLGAFGMAAPVQGGIGTYHVMVSGALLIYGIPQEKGIILATIMHTSQALVMIICGGLSIIALALFYNKTTDVKHEQ